MSRVPSPFNAADRARWLAEVSAALDEAQRLASDMGLATIRNPEARELCARLAVARAQVQSLRLARADDYIEQLGPNWTHPSIWPTNAADGG